MYGTRAISTTSRRELSSSFFFLQGKAPKEIQAILTETLSCFLPGRAKDLSALLYINCAMFNLRRFSVISNPVRNMLKFRRLAVNKIKTNANFSDSHRGPGQNYRLTFTKLDVTTVNS